MNTTEKLLERKRAPPVKKIENKAVGISHADHVAPSPQKLALTLQTSGGRSVGIVRSLTQTTELVLFVVCNYFNNIKVVSSVINTKAYF
jgi:sulfopyruvate decarboxylase TPP-binding subunit